MLLPDNIQPEASIYYGGALVLAELRRKNNQRIIDVYYNINLSHELSYPTLILCLDWLYLLDAVIVKASGDIELCL